MSSSDAACWQVELVDEQLRVTLPADRPLLESLRAEGVKLRHACRNGACEICAVQLLRGTVQQRYPAGSFSGGDEQEPPLILLCTAYPRSDLRLRLMPYARGR